MRKLSPNDRVLASCVVTIVAMIGLTYASVPLYRIFCQVTGFDGTPLRADAAPGANGEGRTIEVRFDANVGPGLPWSFGPEQREVTTKLGENTVVMFKARNQSAAPTAGTATFNVTPEKAAPYFNKIACFCFNRQELKPGQRAELGVSFFVDPAIATDPNTKDITAITLSYTFYPAKPDAATAATAAAGRPAS